MAPERPTPLTPYSPYTPTTSSLQQPVYNPSTSQQSTSSPLAAFPLTIKPTPLTASTFAPYGTVISTSLPPNQDKIPYPPPQGSLPANQGSALKYPSPTPPINNYHLSPSGVPAKAVTNVFSCFPRTLRPTASAQRGKKPTQVFDVRVLERHTYTTQTFIPLSSSSNKNKSSKAIIIVAPSLPPPPASSSSSSGTPYFPQATSLSMGSGSNWGMLPDLRNIQAFIADSGQQGVMYGAGTWHAPMVVVGERRVDFVVSQWMSGREGEDCQEVEIEAGICVDLGVGGDGERDGLWRVGSRL